MLHGLLMLVMLAAPSYAVGDASISVNAALPNGLRVVVVQRPSAQVLQHVMIIRAGTLDEQAGRSGVAHYLEHLLFKDTADYKAGTYEQTIKGWGGSFNAFTSHDITAYHATIPQEKLPDLMRMEASRFMKLEPSAENILPERDVITEERRLRVDSNPMALLMEDMRAALYRNHRYGVPVIGWMHEIHAYTAQSAMDFYHHYYRPDNAILLLVGDISLQQATVLAERYYGAWQAPAASTLMHGAVLQEPPHSIGSMLVHTSKQVQQPQLIRMQTLPHLDVADKKNMQKLAALWLLDDWLSSGASALLEQELVKKQRALYAHCSLDALQRGPVEFTCYVLPAMGVSMEQLESELEALLARMATMKPDEAVLARLKATRISQLLYEEDGIAAFAQRYLWYVALGYESFYAQRQTLLEQVSAEDIQQAARWLLASGGSPVYGRLLPADEVSNPTARKP